MWGDGKQTRSFTFIDDCVEGVLRLTFSDCDVPINATIQSSRAIAPICNIKLHRSPKLSKLIESSKDGKGGGDDIADDRGGKGEQRFSIAHVRRAGPDARPFGDDLMAEKDQPLQLVILGIPFEYYASNNI